MSDTYSEAYGSGPFCRHFADPFDCDYKCARCGHICSQHSYGYGEPFDCLVDGCKCGNWLEDDEGSEPK